MQSFYAVSAVLCLAHIHTDLYTDRQSESGIYRARHLKIYPSVFLALEEVWVINQNIVTNVHYLKFHPCDLCEAGRDKMFNWVAITVLRWLFSTTHSDKDAL